MSKEELAQRLRSESSGDSTYTEFDRGLASDSTGELRTAHRPIEDSDSGTQEDASGIGRDEGTLTGPMEGRGQADATIGDGDTSSHQAQRRRQEKRTTSIDTLPVLSVGTPKETPAEKRAKRDAKKLLEDAEIPERKEPKQDYSSTATISEAEAAEMRPRLIDIYIKVSGLADDALIAVVKDHEYVRIWAMSEIEAEAFVDARLARARVQRKEAKQLRDLDAVYERIMMISYIWPRLLRTGEYIQEHKGFSLR